MIKCWLCKYKSVCRPEMEYKLARKKEREKFQKWYGEYKKGKDKNDNTKMKKIRFDCYTNQWHILPSIMVYKPMEYNGLLIIQLGWLCFRIFITLHQQ